MRTSNCLKVLSLIMGSDYIIASIVELLETGQVFFPGSGYEKCGRSACYTRLRLEIEPQTFLPDENK